MINLELFQAVMSAGDLVDRLLINQIKIERFNNIEKIALLQKESKYIQKALDILRSQITDFDDLEYEACLKGLKTVLYEQWDQLEIVHENIPGRSAKAAIKSHLLNVDRIKWKNKTNRLFKSSEELKDYATKWGNIDQTT